MKAKIRSLAIIFGWLFTLAGLILPGMELLDAATAKPSMAEILKFGRTCEKQTCLLGQCRWKRFKCTQEAALIAEGTRVRHKRHVKIAFGEGVEPKTAWARTSKLKLPRDAKVGDIFPILYRGPRPYYVTTMPTFSHVATGLKCFLFGLFLLYAAGRFSRSGRKEKPVKQAPSREGAPASASATPDAARLPRIPNPFASRPERAPGYTAKPRQNVVQRNTDWF